MSRRREQVLGWIGVVLSGNQNGAAPRRLIRGRLSDAVYTADKRGCDGVPGRLGGSNESIALVVIHRG